MLSLSLSLRTHDLFCVLTQITNLKQIRSSWDDVLS